MAHLTAAASLNQWRWLRSILGARLRPDVHNQRRLTEHRGRTPTETLERFRDVLGSTTAPSGHTPAYLGEVVVHAQDIRQPLGFPRTPSIEALTPVAEFLAGRDFTVASRTHVVGLQLRVDDGPFATGSGQFVIPPGNVGAVSKPATPGLWLQALPGPDGMVAGPEPVHTVLQLFKDPRYLAVQGQDELEGQPWTEDQQCHGQREH